MTARRLPQLDVESPYLTTNELMVWLRLTNRHAVQRLIREHGLPFRRCGHKLLFDKREVDAWSQGFASHLELRRAQRRSA